MGGMWDVHGGEPLPISAGFCSTSTADGRRHVHVHVHRPCNTARIALALLYASAVGFMCIHKLHSSPTPWPTGCTGSGGACVAVWDDASGCGWIYMFSGRVRVHCAGVASGGSTTCMVAHVCTDRSEDCWSDRRTGRDSNTATRCRP